MADIANAREFLNSRGFGALSTQSKRHPGFPFGSLVHYAIDGEGRPIFLLSGLAVHTKNLMEDGRASLLIFGADAESNLLTAKRMTVFGEMGPVPEEVEAEAREAYLKRHPDSAEYFALGGFALYRMAIAEAYYVGGFGEMGWISKLT